MVRLWLNRNLRISHMDLSSRISQWFRLQLSRAEAIIQQCHSTFLNTLNTHRLAALLRFLTPLLPLLVTDPLFQITGGTALLHQAGAAKGPLIGHPG